MSIPPFWDERILRSRIGRAERQFDAGIGTLPLITFHTIRFY